MAGYPPHNHGYGAPPQKQPYGAPAPGYPYGSPPPPSQYGAQPQSQKPSASAAYGSSAPYAAPYGSSAPYAAPPQSNKPEQGGSNVYHVSHVGPGAPPPSQYGSQSSGYPSQSSGYPSQSSGYPSQSSGYPSQSSGYPSQSSGYPSQSSGYPSQYQPSAPPPPYGGQNQYGSLPQSGFPHGTDPNVVACFQAADRDGSGFIDDKELQAALSSYNQSFSLRTVHLLMYLFTNSNSRKIGPKEFTQVFYSLQNWRAIFERFDRDRSGTIDPPELREALLSLGFSVSPVVLDLLVLKFDKTGGRKRGIEYDNFIECCLTVKGLTEKFKEKDTSYSGSATFGYEDFMLTVLPFLIA